jgi:hypothetical protein
MILWLHAYKYAYKEITVETEVPDWARPEFQIPASRDNDKNKENDNENSHARNLQY